VEICQNRVANLQIGGKLFHVGHTRPFYQKILVFCNRCSLQSSIVRPLITCNLFHSLFSPGIKIDSDLITVDLMFWMFMLSSPHGLRDSRFQASDVAAEQKLDKSHDMALSYVVLICFFLCLGTTNGEFRHASGDKQDTASQPPIMKFLLKRSIIFYYLQITCRVHQTIVKGYNPKQGCFVDLLAWGREWDS
jgi:hypothetical protein